MRLGKLRARGCGFSTHHWTPSSAQPAAAVKRELRRSSCGLLSLAEREIEGSRRPSLPHCFARASKGPWIFPTMPQQYSICGPSLNASSATSMSYYSGTARAVAACVLIGWLYHLQWLRRSMRWCIKRRTKPFRGFPPTIARNSELCRHTDDRSRNCHLACRMTRETVSSHPGGRLRPCWPHHAWCYAPTNPSRERSWI